MSAADAYRGTGGPPVRGNHKTHGPAAHATNGLQIRQGAYLPHWTLSEGGIYAVTYRLADSLPQAAIERLRNERDALLREAEQMPGGLSDAERLRLKHLHSEQVEALLDAGHGACWLRQSEVARVVLDNLMHFADQRYRLHAWCIMPNHVHVLIEPLSGHLLLNIVQSWKSYTAKMANRSLGRAGDFWQPEYYDHLIRDEVDYLHIVGYIEQNPLKAGLKDWPWVGRGTGGSPVESLEHGRAARATG